eukprot:CAMPEP_0167763386 /NCGR_PEP_ID=MMETSP0110_2-20121227/13337_1 /TAXON_ID=629695 /ORGANISM="Gymnochlora sp., Strain CCMP2014" /LENGTH=48 /DNA_ID=CAMNT_0007650451 /DNA_START=171 /DNA_END=320 /DNA_ORIENTATION=+
MEKERKDLDGNYAKKRKGNALDVDKSRGKRKKKLEKLKERCQEHKKES